MPPFLFGFVPSGELHSRQQNSRPPPGIAPGIGVGCHQSYTEPSLVDCKDDEVYDIAMFQVRHIIPQTKLEVNIQFKTFGNPRNHSIHSRSAYRLPVIGSFSTALPEDPPIPD